MLHQFYPKKTILPLPYVYLYKKTFYKEISEFFLFIWYALNCSQWYCFRYIFNKMKLRNSWLSFKAYIAFLQHMITHRIATSCWLVATMDILNTLIICYWLNFDTQDSMICLSNYLLCLCLTPKLVSFFFMDNNFLI